MLEHPDGHSPNQAYPPAGHATVLVEGGLRPGSTAAQLVGGGFSPLWWSATRRLAWAAVLVALLWFVIVWAAA